MSCYDLQSLHTKTLMRYRDECYHRNGAWDPTDNHGVYLKLEDILVELNTREHVPNKKEARLNRQARAKIKK